MQRSELAHVLRASSAIANETSFVLVGSQAILLLLDDPPALLLRSTEIDLYPALHPEKSDLIDGAIGALSTFHDTFGYHADGVGPESASLPKDWMDRAVLTYVGEVTAICPDIHDLATSKCAAGRPKDADYVRTLLQHQLVKLDVLVARIGLLDAAKHDLAHIIQWTQRRAQEAAGVGQP
ncbi:MAG: hypothetical protein Q8O29_12270 [Polaromonas sp.]|uniref:DUF6036 family nucleotidyltransferase n=1 Tax=Polaromonas sp. TaxID=1869339 RepID=UPI00273299AB|nr:DUF6036 family nucleotidyltransferase [Polaromonas sp.]MDP2819022.1 hypothetical protein [Polaromonas sp.]